MGAAAKPRFVIVFVMLLSLGVSLGLPAEDVLDAVYDESEALPCETTPLFSIVAPQGSVRIPKGELSHDSLQHFESLMTSCRLCRETSARSLSVPDSLTVTNQPLTLRC